MASLPSADEHILKDEPARRVVRLGGTVRRPAGPHTPAVHSLLAHLHATGFPFAPRPLGLDQQGREVLTYMEGSSGPDGWAGVVPEEGLVAFARLRRAYHDAVRSFRCPADAVWSFATGAPTSGELMCHNDFGPWNVVWRGGAPVGLLDWDLAAPGPPLDDVAYALEYAAPFRDDETAPRWLRYEHPPDRRHRIAVFAAAYGLPDSAGLVDRVVQRQRLTAARVQLLAERGVEPRATWVARGMLDELQACAAWTERNRALVEWPARCSASRG